MPQINIVLDETCAHVEYEKHSVKFTKTISAEALINALVSENGLSLPGILPPGTRFYQKKDNRHRFFIETPPISRMITYLNRDSKPIFEGIVPMPWSLLDISANEDGGVFIPFGGKIYAMMHPLNSIDDKLYHFPSANVGSDGAICWGTTFSEMPPLKTITELGKLVDYYFSSNFNTDIHPRISRYTRYEDLLRSIEGKESFPLDVLVERGRFKNIIQGIKL